MMRVSANRVSPPMYFESDDILVHIPKSAYKYERSARRLLCVNDPWWVEERSNGRLIRTFVNYVEDHELGTAFAFDTMFLFRRRLHVRSGPDMVFFGMDRQEELKDPQRVGHLIPDLVAERRRPSGRHNAEARRMLAYMRAGVRLLWIVDEHAKTISVYRSNRMVRTLKSADVLSGEDVVPGFECPVEHVLRNS